MRVPDVGASTERLLDSYGLYHLTRLQADPSLKDLADAFSLAQKRLKQRNDEFQAAEAAAMTALAVRDTKDDELDEAVRGFFLALLRKVLNNRKAPLFLKYFPDGVTPVIGAASEDEVRVVGILLQKLSDEQDLDLKAHAPTLTQAVDNLTAAISAYETAVDAQKLAFGVMQSEKLAWTEGYKRSYRELQLRFFDNPKRVERFFRPARRTAPAEPEPHDGPVVPTPSAGATA